MYRVLKTAMVSFLVVSLVLVPLAGTVLAAEEYEKQDISADKMAADLFIARPVGLASMFFGGVMFLFSLPFSFSEESMDENRAEVGENLQKMIVEPSKYTFNRRLGDL